MALRDKDRELAEVRTQVLAELRRVAEQKDSVYLELAAARERIAALEKDSARLDWLGQHFDSQETEMQLFTVRLKNPTGSFRAAVDAARSLVYFDGVGVWHDVLTVAVWALAGLVLNMLVDRWLGRRERPSAPEGEKQLELAAAR